MTSETKHIKNIAIIAHVDHGKTTLVDKLLTASGTMKAMEDQSLIMDSNDQEKERGITIYAKNTAVQYTHDGTDYTINIIDTPGHADFGSEVERGLRMVDSVLLVVDAYEGPMPQTKFVLKKALELGMRPVVVLNKIDKPSARPDWVIDELFDLFVNLGATDEQADFPVIYASAKNGYAFNDMDEFADAQTNGDMTAVFDMIFSHVPDAPSDTDAPFRLQVVNLGYDDFVGRLAIGRIAQGRVRKGQQVIVRDADGNQRKGKVSQLYTTLGVSRIETDEAVSGDIVTIAGIPDIYVGETIGLEGAEPFAPLHIDEPTLAMDFLVNDSPFAGQDGKQVTSRNIMERLQKELETNVGLRVDFETGHNRYTVSGRGELHLSVLIETMRREGFELQVSASQVIMKEENGQRLEPIEHVVVTVDDPQSGAIINALSERKGQMTNMNSDGTIATIEFEVPTRGLIGFRSDFILMTKGEGLMYSSFSHYDSYKGDIPKRNVGSMISQVNGETMRYSLWKLQERGKLFVGPVVKVYEGMIIGEHSKAGDLTVNATKNKQLTNMRSQGHDEAMRLEPITEMTLEYALSYIGNDEYVEITPNHIRLRKIYLKEGDRKRYSK